MAHSRALPLVALGLGLACMIMSCSGQTVLDVNIGADVTWTLAGSPYTIDGPQNNGRVDVGPDVTITVEAGVEILCGGSTGDNCYIYWNSIQAGGRFTAVGTAENPIQLTDVSLNAIECDIAHVEWAGVPQQLQCLGGCQIANADISDLTELRCLGYDIADSDLSGFTEDSLLSADVQTDIPSSRIFNTKFAATAAENVLFDMRGTDATFEIVFNTFHGIKLVHVLPGYAPEAALAGQVSYNLFSKAVASPDTDGRIGVDDGVLDAHNNNFPCIGDNQFDLAIGNSADANIEGAENWYGVDEATVLAERLWDSTRSAGITNQIVYAPVLENMCGAAPTSACDGSSWVAPSMDLGDAGCGEPTIDPIGSSSGSVAEVPILVVALAATALVALFG